MSRESYAAAIRSGQITAQTVAKQIGQPATSIGVQRVMLTREQVPRLSEQKSTSTTSSTSTKTDSLQTVKDITSKTLPPPPIQTETRHTLTPISPEELTTQHEKLIETSKQLQKDTIVKKIDDQTYEVTYRGQTSIYTFPKPEEELVQQPTGPTGPTREETIRKIYGEPGFYGEHKPGFIQPIKSREAPPWTIPRRTNTTATVKETIANISKSEQTHGGFYEPETIRQRNIEMELKKEYYIGEDVHGEPIYLPKTKELVLYGYKPSEGATKAEQLGYIITPRGEILPPSTGEVYKYVYGGERPDVLTASAFSKSLFGVGTLFSGAAELITGDKRYSKRELESLQEYALKTQEYKIRGGYGGGLFLSVAQAPAVQETVMWAGMEVGAPVIFSGFGSLAAKTPVFFKTGAVKLGTKLTEFGEKLTPTGRTIFESIRGTSATILETTKAAKKPILEWGQAFAKAGGTRTGQISLIGTLYLGTEGQQLVQTAKTDRYLFPHELGASLTFWGLMSTSILKETKPLSSGFKKTFEETKGKPSLLFNKESGTYGDYFPELLPKKPDTRNITRFIKEESSGPVGIPTRNNLRFIESKKGTLEILENKPGELTFKEYGGPKPKGTLDIIESRKGTMQLLKETKPGNIKVIYARERTPFQPVEKAGGFRPGKRIPEQELNIPLTQEQAQLYQTQRLTQRYGLEHRPIEGWDIYLGEKQTGIESLEVGRKTFDIRELISGEQTEKRVMTFPRPPEGYKDYLRIRQLQEIYKEPYMGAKRFKGASKYLEEEKPFKHTPLKFTKEEPISTMKIEGKTIGKETYILEQPEQKLFRPSGLYESPELKYVTIKRSLTKEEYGILETSERGLQISTHWTKIKPLGKSLLISGTILGETKLGIRGQTQEQLGETKQKPIRIGETISKNITGLLGKEKQKTDTINKYDVASISRIGEEYIERQDERTQQGQKIEQMMKQEQLLKQEQISRTETIYDTITDLIQPTPRRTTPRRTTLPTPRPIIPYIPGLPGESKKETRKQKEERHPTGFIPEVHEKGRWIQLTRKTLREREAKNLLGETLDETKAAVGRLRPSKGTLQSLGINMKDFGLIAHKFRQKGELLIEKRQYRMDSLGEERQITAKGWMANRLKGTKNRLNKNNILGRKQYIGKLPTTIKRTNKKSRRQRYV